MGGTVAVTVRMPDGEEFRMNRWTNSLLGFYEDLRFFKKSKRHVKRYLSQWLEMKVDWEENRGTKKFKHLMTSVYAPYPGLLAPNYYGIVVFDLMKNVVVSNQGYTAFSRSFVTDKNFDPERWANQIKLFEAGRVKTIQRFGRSNHDFFELPVPETKEEFLEKILSDPFLTYLTYDTSPFEVFDYEESKKGLQEAKQKILDLGFVLTEKEEKAWNAFIRGK